MNTLNQVTTAAAPVKFVGSANIRHAIAGITAMGAKLDAVIQDAALSVIWHVEKHGDVTLVCELYNGMPKGSRKLALAEWLLAFGKVEANVDAKTKAALPFTFAKDKETKLDMAIAKPWFDFKPEAPVDLAFDFQKLLMGLLNKAGKAAQSDKEIIGADLLAKVRALTLATPE